MIGGAERDPQLVGRIAVRIGPARIHASIGHRGGRIDDGVLDAGAKGQQLMHQQLAVGTNAGDVAIVMQMIGRRAEVEADGRPVSAIVRTLGTTLSISCGSRTGQR